jgi:benzodiazapine receptor
MQLTLLLASETQKTYMALKQPPYRPPPYVFGPAWTALYGLMGYAAHRAYSTGMSPIASANQLVLTKQGATLYTIQLGLNLIWMPLFFIAKRPIEATVDIVALTGVTGYLTYVWGQVDPVAGWALAPYLGWLGFATYLTVGVAYLVSSSIVKRHASGCALSSTEFWVWKVD